MFWLVNPIYIPFTSIDAIFLGPKPYLELIDGCLLFRRSRHTWVISTKDGGKAPRLQDKGTIRDPCFVMPLSQVLVNIYKPSPKELMQKCKGTHSKKIGRCSTYSWLQTQKQLRFSKISKVMEDCSFSCVAVAGPWPWPSPWPAGWLG